MDGYFRADELYGHSPDFLDKNHLPPPSPFTKWSTESPYQVQKALSILQLMLAICFIKGWVFKVLWHLGNVSQYVQFIFLCSKNLLFFPQF